jgi:hypothetical protein
MGKDHADVIGPHTVEAFLCALLQRWCEDNGLECHSADEMLSERQHEQARLLELGYCDLTQIDAQVDWLKAYCALWDASEI